jgi:hypothetical protein
LHRQLQSCYAGNLLCSSRLHAPAGHAITDQWRRSQTL